MKNRKICVILNVGSGKKDVNSQPQSIHAAFALYGVEITLKTIKKGVELTMETQKAVDEGYTTIVAAGGDGTVCAVAQIISASKAVMGILPLGTFNYFARSLNLPMGIDAAAKVITAGHAMPLRVATVNGSMFLNNASIGVYPAILKTREDIYRRWGRSRMAAYVSVIKTLITERRPLRLRITLDGKSRDIRSPLVFVVNNAYQLQQMSVSGTDKIEAGELAVFIAPDTGRFGMIRLAVSLALRSQSFERDFELVGAKEILIENNDGRAHKKRTIAKDGERERMQAPLRFRVVNEALSILVPDGQPGHVR